MEDWKTVRRLFSDKLDSNRWSDEGNRHHCSLNAVLYDMLSELLENLFTLLLRNNSTDSMKYS